jgi:hypothetical protein
LAAYRHDAPGEVTVKYRLIAVAAIGLTLVAAPARVGLAAPAQARGAVPQVPGTVLQTALLPPGEFGDGFTWVASGAPNSGGTVLPYRTGLDPVDMSCGAFESIVFLEAYGQTGAALESFANPNWQTDNPDIWEGNEFVFQFASDQEAATFYREAHAEYVSCQSLTVPQPSDTAIGGGALDLSTMWLTNTTIAGYPAFTQVQSAARSETPGLNFFRNTLTVVAGADVYQIFDYSGTDDEPSPTLMADLIQRVQRLA